MAPTAALALLVVCAVACASAIAIPTGGTDFAVLDNAGPFADNAQWTITVTATPKADIVVCVSWATPMSDPVVASLDAVWEKTCPRAATNFLACNASETCELTVAPQPGKIFVNVFNADTVDTDVAVAHKASKCAGACTVVALPVGNTQITPGTQIGYYTPSKLSTPDNYFSVSLKINQDATVYAALASYATAEQYDYSFTFAKTDTDDELILPPALNSLADATNGLGWYIFIDTLSPTDITVAETVATKTNFMPLSPSTTVYIPDEKVDTTQVFFIENRTSIDLVVAGLDGYEQLEVAPDVLVQLDGVPSKESFLVYASGAEANRVTIDLTGIANEDSVWYLTVTNAKDVYAYGIWTPVNETAPCPGGNCGDHGECDADTLVCGCDKGYDGLSCEHKVNNYSAEYIVLVAVGGLLVLSVVIGIPIYCYLNRQQDYDVIE